MNVPPTTRFDGKAALVIGGSSGIGLAVARQMLAEQAWVAIAGRDDARLAAAADTVPEGQRDRLATLVGDISVPGEADRMVDAAMERLGRLDILVAAAARNYTGAIDVMADAEIEAIFRTNALGPLYAARAAARAFGTHGGRIVTISGMSAQRGTPRRAVYGASKAAVDSFTRSLAVELAPRGITVNCVSPGLTDTPMLSAAGRTPAAVSAVPMGRLGQPEEVAAVICFLASDEAGWVTGQIVGATGGYGL